jgi:hypothetical protein
MNERLIWRLTFALCSVSISGCSLFDAFGRQGKVEQLSLNDCDPALAQAVQARQIEDPLVGTPIEYETFDYPQYDGFFKESAQVHCKLFVARTLTETVAASWKQVAVDRAGIGTIHDAVGGKPSPKWTVEDTLAVLRLEVLRGDISPSQLQEQAKASIAQVKTISTIVKGLPSVAGDLAKRATGFDTKGIPVQQIPKLTKAVDDSLQQLEAAGKDAEKVFQDVTVFGAALEKAALNGVI